MLTYYISTVARANVLKNSHGTVCAKEAMPSAFWMQKTFLMLQNIILCNCLCFLRLGHNIQKLITSAAIAKRRNPSQLLGQFSIQMLLYKAHKKRELLHSSAETGCRTIKDFLYTHTLPEFLSFGIWRQACCQIAQKFGSEETISLSYGPFKMIKKNSGSPCEKILDAKLGFVWCLHCNRNITWANVIINVLM